MQRVFDILFSGLALIVLSPFLIAIMIILKLTGEHEIFYIQKRVGKDGKMFGLLKFATMLKNSPNIGNGTITVHDDPRVLPFGKFLRKTKLNELPQLINVLKGDMSIIGPRPMIESTFLSYSENVQKNIKKVRPGLSGIGSIIFRDEETIMTNIKTAREEFYKNHILPYKGELEVWYVQNKSIYIYFILIFLTILIILYPKNESYKYVLSGLPKKPKSLNEEFGV